MVCPSTSEIKSCSNNNNNNNNNDENNTQAAAQQQATTSKTSTASCTKAKAPAHDNTVDSKDRTRIVYRLHSTRQDNYCSIIMASESKPSSNKKAKTAHTSEPPKQASLHDFFGKPKASKSSSVADSSKREDSKATIAEKAISSEATDATSSSDNDKKDAIPNPIIPHAVTRPDPRARWKVVENCMMVRSIAKEEPRSKAAAFDVDGTLLVWRIAGWPSQLDHYELWNASLVQQIRNLHDDDGMKLVLFSNQGAIRSAFTGKKATHVKALFEWIAATIDRPVHIVLSTNKKLGYHKPNPGMWEICERHCNRGEPLDVTQSFFVGDSVGDDDPQGGVDSKFAVNVGQAQGTGKVLKFYTPEEYFGPSDSSRRKTAGLLAGYEVPPTMALEARKQLLGGYGPTGPIMLLLSGVQGSGKSTFCEKVCGPENANTSSSSKPWVHYSQDTINKGKPGKREAVEEKVRQAIREGQSVIVDRTHLDPTQRKDFVDIAKELKVPVHVLVLQPPKDLIAKRVRERTNHPGRVEGEQGARLALSSLAKAVVPKYVEGFDLITHVKRDDGVERMSRLYRQIMTSSATSAVGLERNCLLSCGAAMPTMALGTMGIGKRAAPEAICNALKLGWEGIDTAPTYKNEEEVGKGITSATKKKDAFVIVKVPKRATKAQHVFDELGKSLDNLDLTKADLLLLHWPCDVIVAGTMKEVWEAMEKCVADGKCRSLGVCNFSVDALRILLPMCTIPPAVNQVERHPLLPQTELLDFCINQDIVLQAHTPLGHGKLLDHETIVEVAEQANLSPAQVLLQWNLKQGVSNACKSSTEEHQKEIVEVYNAGGSTLKAEDMKVLDGITDSKRFISPPFMMEAGNVYSWKVNNTAQPEAKPAAVVKPIVEAFKPKVEV